jgi:hypothetical protein
VFVDAGACESAAALARRTRVVSQVVVADDLQRRLR